MHESFGTHSEAETRRAIETLLDEFTRTARTVTPNNPSPDRFGAQLFLDAMADVLADRGWEPLAQLVEAVSFLEEQGFEREIRIALEPVWRMFKEGP